MAARLQPLIAVVQAIAYAVAGSVLLVAMCMYVVLVDETPRKAAAIVLAVTAVWLLSRGGAIFYRLLFGLPA